MKRNTNVQGQEKLPAEKQGTEEETSQNRKDSRKSFWRGSSFWISCGVCLLPILFGLSVYEQLPEQIATHWGANGTPNGWSPKAMAVFGIPGGLLALNAVLWFMLHNDPKNVRLHRSLLAIGHWTVPLLSLITSAIIYLNALSQPLDPSLPVSMATGFLIVVVGNYLPKCRPSYTVGIRLPWTLNDEENWTKTHRFGGKLWVVGGFLIIAAGLLRQELLLFLAVGLMLVPPIVYSYVLYRRTYK